VNYRLFELLNNLAGRFDNLDDVMDFAATSLVYLVAAAGAGLAGLAAYQRRWRALIECAVALLLAFGAALGLGRVSRQLEPFQTHVVHQLVGHAEGVSLPGGHATAAFTIAFAVIAFLDRGWGLALLAVAVLIGVAGIWVGVHYPTDAAAAAAVGGLAVLEVKVWSLWLPVTLRDVGARPPAKEAS
jgi:undecaprenyl-diphosphatase